MVHAITLITVLLAIAELGTCLNCYSCEDPGINCDTDFADKKVKCSEGVKYCHMMKFGNRDVGFAVIRECGNPYLNTTAKIKRYCATHNAETCEICDKDLCNGSSAVASAIPLAILALITAYIR